MSNKNKEKRKVFLIFAALGCFFSFFQPTCGAFTRVTGSGDGCPDWPTCFGSWVPPLNDINAIIEWSHRTSGTLFGLVSISVLIFSFLIYKKFNNITIIYTSALILIVIVGGIGGIVVLSDLDPAIRTLHLAGALIIAALMTTGISLETIRPESNFGNKIKFIAVTSAIFTLVTILSGAYMVWQQAGAVCYKWPLCSDYLLPKHSSQWIHMIHRIISIGLIYYLFIINYNLMKYYPSTFASKIGKLFLIIGLSQFFSGALIPLTEFTVWSRTLHLSLATLTWMLSVAIIISVRGYKINNRYKQT